MGTQKKVATKVARAIKSHYQCHGVAVDLRLQSVSSDCRSFTFQVLPQPGTRVGAIFEHAEDIQTALQMPFFQLFKEEVVIYLAVSEDHIRARQLLSMLKSPTFRNSKASLPVALGYDLMGRMVIEDLEKMPHAMYVGATRSGKSVGLICLVMSLLCVHSSNEMNLIVFDVGASSLDILSAAPHLSTPIVKDVETGIHVIRALADEMERRIGLDSLEQRNLPAIVCVMDEYVSFIGSIVDKQQRHSVADSITNLLRRGRKAKIHMVLATQNPKDGAMEAEMGNITSRMAFKVARHQTSIAVLNCAGAEKLPGNGAMLYQSMEHPDPIYVQGAYISTEEAEQLLMRIQAANQDLGNKFEVPEAVPKESSSLSDNTFDAAPAQDTREKELSAIIVWLLGHETISAEKIKAKYAMGNRVNEIMDKLCELELVSEKFARQPRNVLPQSIEDIPEAVLNLLNRNGYSEEDVSAAIGKRGCCNPASCGEEGDNDAD